MTLALIAMAGMVRFSTSRTFRPLGRTCRWTSKDRPTRVSRADIGILFRDIFFAFASNGKAVGYQVTDGTVGFGEISGANARDILGGDGGDTPDERVDIFETVQGLHLA